MIYNNGSVNKNINILDMALNILVVFKEMANKKSLCTLIFGNNITSIDWLFKHQAKKQ